LLIFIDKKPQDKEKKKRKNRGKKKKDCRPLVESSSLSPLASVVPIVALLFPFIFFSFAVFCNLHYSATRRIESELIHCLPFTCNVNSGE
jgi:hypothetical protein